MRKTISLSMSIILLSCNLLLAHGIRVETVMNHPYVTLKASFSPRSLLSDAYVEIHAPSSVAIFQKGHTDSKGRFVFMPDEAGEWKVLIDDEKGHKRTIGIQISDVFFATTETPAMSDSVMAADTLCAHAEGQFHHHHSHEGHVPLYYKIFLGLALIFGITGIYYGLKSRKS